MTDANSFYTVGVEIVQASLDDPSTLSTALAGCYGVFGVTNFWEHMQADKEITQVRIEGKMFRGSSGGNINTVPHSLTISIRIYF